MEWRAVGGHAGDESWMPIWDGGFFFFFFFFLFFFKQAKILQIRWNDCECDSLPLSFLVGMFLFELQNIRSSFAAPAVCQHSVLPGGLKQVCLCVGFLCSDRILTCRIKSICSPA